MTWMCRSTVLTKNQTAETHGVYVSVLDVFIVPLSWEHWVAHWELDDLVILIIQRV